MSIIRMFYYIVKSISVNIFKRDVKVALSSQIKPGTTFGRYVRISKNTYITGDIGDYTYVGPNCRLNAKVGKYCSISPNVKVVNATHPVHMISTSPVFFSPKKQCGFSHVLKSEFEELLYADDENKYSCIIGNDVWVGENVIIKGGVTIGDGAIIAMGAVVTKDVPPYSIYGGVPAKEISKRFSDEKIQYLINLSWWDKSHDWIEKNKELFLHSNEFFDGVNIIL